MLQFWFTGTPQGMHIPVDLGLVIRVYEFLLGGRKDRVTNQDVGESLTCA